MADYNKIRETRFIYPIPISFFYLSFPTSLSMYKKNI